MTKRDRMIAKIKTSGKEHEIARRIEQSWFDAAWAASLHTDDANHAPCDHNEKTFQKAYRECAQSFFGE